MRTCALLLITAVLAVGCSKKDSAKVAESPPLFVETLPVTAECIYKTLPVYGEIHAADSIAVFSKTAGKLATYAVKKGATVQKGELLASIDRDEVGYKYNQAPVYSPITGVVALLVLDQGAEVRSDFPIAQIINIEKVKALFSLPEKYRPAVHVGQQISLIGDSPLVATVSEINPFNEAASHSFMIEAEIENSAKNLVPGMFIAGEIFLEKYEESVMLPEASIIPSAGEWHIYKVLGEKAVLEKVKLGIRKEGRVQILEGAAPGDVVIVGGNHKVKSGQKIQAKAV